MANCHTLLPHILIERRTMTLRETALLKQASWHIKGGPASSYMTHQSVRDRRVMVYLKQASLHRKGGPASSYMAHQSVSDWCLTPNFIYLARLLTRLARWRLYQKRGTSVHKQSIIMYAWETGISRGISKASHYRMCISNKLIGDCTVSHGG